jgi:hypothetical protein
MGAIVEKLKVDTIDLAALGAWLDSLDPETRLLEARAIGPAAQRRLWPMLDATDLTLADFVPTSAEPLTSVRHYGRNTLPVFKLFEKRFCRAPDGTDTAGLWGYNEGSTRPLVGPGYFVCRDTDGDDRGSVVIDYTLVPSGKCDEWPDYKPNEAGVSRFVYSGMQDFMRRISNHVTLGRAYIKGKASNNYFILCREG